MFIRRLSLGMLLLLAGCATVERRYTTPYDVNDGRGPACGDEAQGFMWRFRLSCNLTSYGYFVPHPYAQGTYEDPPLGWQIADVFGFVITVPLFVAGFAVSHSAPVGGPP